MNPYHKIYNVFKKDKKTEKLIKGDWVCPEFDYLSTNTWVFTEKIDGTNIRVIFNFKDGTIYIKGKTDNANIPLPLMTAVYDKFYGHINKMLKLFANKTVCFYGVGYGQNIQSGSKYIKDGVDFILFDVKIDNFWLKRDNMVTLADELGINCVPIVGKGNLFDAINIVEIGLKSNFGDFLAEGIVAKPEIELTDRSGKRIITKIKTVYFNKSLIK